MYSSYKNLQEEYVDVYKEFFASNDLVLSGCFSMRRWPSSFWHNSSKLRISIKLPIKCFVWIKLVNTQNIEFEKILYYDSTDNKFCKSEFNKIYTEDKKLKNLVQEFIKDNWFTWGMKVSILSEVSRWHGVWFSATFAAVFSTCLHVLLQKLDIEILNDNAKFIKSDLLKEVHLLAWKIDYISRYGNSIWDSVMCTLNATRFPMIYFCDKFSGDIGLEKLKNIRYFNYNFKDFINVDTDNLDIPFDYWMIYAGMPSDTIKVEEYKKLDIKRLNEYEEYLKDWLLKDEKMFETISFYKFTKKDSIYDSFNENITILDIMTLKLFKQIFESWFDRFLINRFIDHMTQYYYAMCLIEDKCNFVEYFKWIFDEMKQNNSERIWLLPVNSWKLGWGYLFAMKQWISRNTLIQTVEKVRQYYPNVGIEYASYEDWLWRDGVLLEQYISKNVFSKYVWDDKLFVKNNNWWFYFWSYNDILEKEQEWLLLDTINQKIYLNWEKVTSKDLHSQSSTIELLELLVKYPWKEIPNEKFSISCYSKNKNSMSGKIITPLQKLLKNEVWKTLSLICKWSIYKYFVKLDKTDIKITIIKSIK